MAECLLLTNENYCACEILMGVHYVHIKLQYVSNLTWILYDKGYLVLYSW